MAAPSASSNAGVAGPVPLTPSLISSFKLAKFFRAPLHNVKDQPFTSLSFDDKGELLITSSEDESMQLFNCRTGKHQKQYYSKKYGVCLARFTHKSTNVIHASTKLDHSIRYLSLHDNNYLRYFRGHTSQVVSLEMSPREDTFLSGATDDTVRLWDIRAEKSQGRLNLAGRPSVAYDPCHDIFAVALNLGSSISLYDARSYDKEPFGTVVLQEQGEIYTSLKFSNDGKWILLGTSGEIAYVIDSFEYKVVARLQGNDVRGLGRSPFPPYANSQPPSTGISGNEICWTPDSRYVVSGTISGELLVWDVNPPPGFDPNRPPPSPNFTLLPLATLTQDAGFGPSRCVAFNPRNAMMVSAGDDLAFWLPPNPEEDILH